MTSYSNITTLNQLVANIQEIATQHRQINDFKYGNTWEHYASGTTNTPELWCNVDTASVGVASTTFTVSFWLVDSVIRGEIDELERHSDLTLIAEDFIAKLRGHEYGWLVDRTAEQSLQYLVEYSPKNLAGITFTINITIKRLDRRCDIPFINQPI